MTHLFNEQYVLMWCEAVQLGAEATTQETGEANVSLLKTSKQVNSNHHHLPSWFASSLFEKRLQKDEIWFLHYCPMYISSAKGLLVYSETIPENYNKAFTHRKWSIIANEPF